MAEGKVAFGELTTYQKWLEAEGIDVIKGYMVDDVGTLPLKPWPRKGGLGAHIYLMGCEDCDDAYVCEIPPKASLKPQKHLFEEIIVILRGLGKTEVWNDGGRKVTCEWKKGSLFAIPLNANHQHFNLADKPVRYLAVTDAPPVIDLFHSNNFVFYNNFVFGDRFNGQENYFRDKGRLVPGTERIWEANHIPNVETFELATLKGRGGRSIRFELANNTMTAHISEFPVGTYKKAHRHAPGAHILILKGKGYTLMWLEGQPIQRFDWHEGSVLAPPRAWFHQHFNTGKEPARYLALRWGSQKFLAGKHFSEGEAWFSSVKEGGNQIEYEDEDPKIRKSYERELAKEGIELKLPKIGEK